MERWEDLVKLVKEFYIAFGQQEFLENEMTEERKRLRELLFTEEQLEYMKAKIENDSVGKLDAVCDMYYVKIGTLLEENRGDTNKVSKIIFLNEDIEINEIWQLEVKNRFEEIIIEAFEEVHRSNMSKLDENGEPVFYTKGSKKGKIGKSKLYKEPNLKQFIERLEAIE